MTRTLHFTGALMIAAMMMASEASAQEAGVEDEAQALTTARKIESDLGDDRGALHGLSGKLRAFFVGLLSDLRGAKEKLAAYVSGEERGEGQGIERAREHDPRGNAFGLRAEGDGERPGKRVARGLVRGEDGRPAHAKAGGRGLRAPEADEDADEGGEHGKRLGQTRGQGQSHARGQGRRGATD